MRQPVMANALEAPSTTTARSRSGSGRSSSPGASGPSKWMRR
jgi:hypothetical protein